PHEAPGPDPAPWRAGLDDPDASVRRTAVASLPEAALAHPGLAPLLQARLADRDPRVRAAAAARLGDAGQGVLLAMLGDADPEHVLAALEVLPAELAAHAAPQLAASAPPLRAAALEALARARDPGALPPADALLAAAADPDTLVRRAAVALLAASPLEEATAALARALRAFQAARVREAWESLLLARAPAAGAPAAAPAERFLVVACHDAFARALRLAFRALAALEDPAVVRSIVRALRHAPGRARRRARGADAPRQPRSLAGAGGAARGGAGRGQDRGAARAGRAPALGGRAHRACGRTP